VRADYLDVVADRWAEAIDLGERLGGTDAQLAELEALSHEFREGTGHRLDVDRVEWRTEVTPAGALRLSWTRWPRLGGVAALARGHYNRARGPEVTVTALLRGRPGPAPVTVADRRGARILQGSGRGLPAEAAERLSVPVLRRVDDDTWGLLDEGSGEVLFRALPPDEVRWREGPIVFARGEVFAACPRWRHPVTGDAVSQLRPVGPVRALAVRALRWAGAEAGLIFAAAGPGVPGQLHLPEPT
jgi:hypothetical protein